MTPAARVLLRPAAPYRYLPEGPRALRSGRLLWITIQCGPSAAHGALHVFDPTTGDNRTWQLPGRPGFALETDRDDVFLIGMERELGEFDGARGTWTVLGSGIDADCEGTIVNDGEPFEGGVVFGTKDTAFAEPKASLWFWRRSDRTLHRLRTGQLCSNGKVLRPLGGDRWELFDIDSPSRVVTRCELDARRGVASAPTVAIDLRDQRAVPDGMVLVPGADEVVVAMFDPGPADAGRALRCSLRTGEVRETIAVPGAAQVTCPAWLPGAAGSRLVLATAAEHLSPERLVQQPDAGCLFVCEPTRD